MARRPLSLFYTVTTDKEANGAPVSPSTSRHTPSASRTNRTAIHIAKGETRRLRGLSSGAGMVHILSRNLKIAKIGELFDGDDRCFDVDNTQTLAGDSAHTDSLL